MSISVSQILKNISDNIIISKKEFPANGNIFSGKAGIILFLANYYQIEKQEQHLSIIYELINDILNNLENEKSGSLSGVAGIGWTLQYLVKKDILRRDQINPYLQQIYTAIASSLHQYFDNGYYDLMHGYIGKLIFLIDANEYSSDPSKIVQLLEESIMFFQKTAIRGSSQTMYWRQPDFGSSAIENKACLGMAHGIPSIISFLSLLLEGKCLTNKKSKEAAVLIEQSCQWILDKENQYKVKNGLFPTFIPPNEENLDSFLAWCYGDLGIAISLIRAGNALNNKRLYKEGVRIAEHAAKRPIEHSGVSSDLKRIDSTLCHGTFGILYQFHLLYKRTGIQIFKKTTEYWLNLATSHINFDEPFCNLKSCITSRNSSIKEWETLHSLLGGVSGVGLVLLSMYSSKCNDWLRILLLDF